MALPACVSPLGGWRFEDRNGRNYAMCGGLLDVLSCSKLRAGVRPGAPVRSADSQADRTRRILRRTLLWRANLLPEPSKLRLRPAYTLTLVLIALSAVAAFTLDRQTHTLLMSLRGSAGFIYWREIVTPLGKADRLAMALVALWLLGVALKRPSVRQAALWGAVAVLSSALAATLIKLIVHRSRPCIPVGRTGHIKQGYYQSFPSAESATAFALALALGDCFPRYRILFLAAAITIATMRVLRLAHWPSDALAGAALGCAVYGAVAAWRRASR